MAPGLQKALVGIGAVLGLAEGIYGYSSKYSFPLGAVAFNVMIGAFFAYLIGRFIMYLFSRIDESHQGIS